MTVYNVIQEEWGEIFVNSFSTEEQAIEFAKEATGLIYIEEVQLNAPYIAKKIQF